MLPSLFRHDEIEVHRPAWKVALRTALGLGITGRVSEWHREACKAFVHRKFASRLRQKQPWIGRSRPLDHGETRPAARIRRKVASWKALVELYKSLSVDVFKDAELSRIGSSPEFHRK